MSATLYAALQNTAAALLKQFGVGLTWTTKTDGVYSSATLQAAPSESTFVVNTLAVELPEREINGQSVLRGDVKLIVSAKPTSGTGTFDPKTNDNVVMADGTVMTVVDKKRIRPAGSTVVLLIVYVRGGGGG